MVYEYDRRFCEHSWFFSGVDVSIKLLLLRVLRRAFCVRGFCLTLMLYGVKISFDAAALIKDRDYVKTL